MTILQALNWAQEQLKETAQEKQDARSNPMVDAQILLAAILQKPTSYLFANFEQALQDQEVLLFQRTIARRKRHEPVAYLLQTKHFYGRPFYVNPSVLIPRPATEQLIEHAIKCATPDTSIIDVGTGSGAISVTIAKELNQPVIAIDVDAQGLNVARHNARRHNVHQRISFLHGSLLEPMLNRNIRETSDGHTIITANLPYLTPNQWQALDPDVLHYEPKHALVGGIDGLELYDQLLQQVVSERERFGAQLDLFFEIDPSQKQKITALVNEYLPKASTDLYDDLQKLPRIVHICT